MSAAQVHAAGAVLTDAMGRVAVIHRPKRGDWSLPKGKQEPGETDAETARREVTEETGYAAEMVADLGEVSYRDHRDRLKTVRYFHMAVRTGGFAANDEVDELRWLSWSDAIDRLTYQADRDLLVRSRDGVEAWIRDRPAPAGPS